MSAGTQPVKMANIIFVLIHLHWEQNIIFVSTDSVPYVRMVASCKFTSEPLAWTQCRTIAHISHFLLIPKIG
jgi:hypothetical protein